MLGLLGEHGREAVHGEAGRKRKKQTEHGQERSREEHEQRKQKSSEGEQENMKRDGGRELE